MSDTLTVFLWSLPEETAFRDYLRSLAGSLTVCPLRPAAWYAARRLFREDEIFDCRSLIGSEEREEFDRRASENASRLRRALVGYRFEPWLEGFEYYHKVSPLLYYYYYWEALLERLRGRGAGELRMYGPFSRGSIPGGLLLEVDVLEETAGGGTEGRRRMLHRLGGIAGWAITRGTGLDPPGFRLWRRGERAGRKSVVLAGLQETDAVFQGPLAAALGERLGEGFRWWRISSAGARLSRHEVPGSETTGLVDIFEQGDATRRSGRWWRCVREYLIQRVATACRSFSDEEILHRHAGSIARILVESHPDVVGEYRRVARYLDWTRPRLVVGSSNLGRMSHVRAWCRHHGVPYIRLPHGAEAPPRHWVIHDADFVALLGKYDCRRLEEHGTGAACIIGGGMHLADQGNELKRMISVGRNRESREVCYLVSASLYADYPDTFTETEHDLEELAGAVRTAGGRLRVRPHPRAHDREVYEEIYRNRLLEIVLSDPARSLADDLRGAAVATARLWSGACVLALYCGIPLVAWLPRGGTPDSSAKLERLPLVARTSGEFRELIERLLVDEGYRAQVVEEQERVLQAEIEDPYGDGYRRVVEFITDFVQQENSEKGNLSA